MLIETSTARDNRRPEMVDADNGEGISPGSSSMSYPKQLSPHLELQLLRGGAAPGLGWMQQSLQQAERCKSELVETWSCFDSSDRVLEPQREEQRLR